MPILHFPIVCDPERIAGAEDRARKFPHLDYTWAIKYALTPITIKRNTRGLPDYERLERRAESDRAHRRTMRRGASGTAWDRS